MGGQLALNTKLEGMARCGCSLLQGALLEWRNDMHIKSRWSSLTPVREEYISGPRRGVEHKAKNLLQRCQSRRLGSTEDHIPNGVVTRDSIAVASTSDLMVSIGIMQCHGILDRNSHHYEEEPLANSASSILEM